MSEKHSSVKPPSEHEGGSVSTCFVPPRTMNISSRDRTSGKDLHTERELSSVCAANVDKGGLGVLASVYETVLRKRILTITGPQFRANSARLCDRYFVSRIDLRCVARSSGAGYISRLNRRNPLDISRTDRGARLHTLALPVYSIYV